MWSVRSRRNESLDFLQDARAAGIAEHSSARPLKSGLGRDEHARAEMTLGEGLADDFFRTAESIGRSGIDEIDAVLDSRSDRGNGFRVLGSTPHPAPDGPGA